MTAAAQLDLFATPAPVARATSAPAIPAAAATADILSDAAWEALNAVHPGPGFEDDGTGCDCCAARLRCAQCGARFLARTYAYYYDYKSADADGYMVPMASGYDRLLGPCCLPPEQLLDGQFVEGAYGVFRSRIWVPAAWPTGPTPRDTFMEARDAAHKAQRGRHRKGGRRGCA